MPWQRNRTAPRRRARSWRPRPWRRSGLAGGRGISSIRTMVAEQMAPTVIMRLRCMRFCRALESFAPVHLRRSGMQSRGRQTSASGPTHSKRHGHCLGHTTGSRRSTTVARPCRHALIANAATRRARNRQGNRAPGQERQSARCRPCRALPFRAVGTSGRGRCCARSRRACGSRRTGARFPFSARGYRATPDRRPARAFHVHDAGEGATGYLVRATNWIELVTQARDEHR